MRRSSGPRTRRHEKTVVLRAVLELIDGQIGSDAPTAQFRWLLDAHDVYSRIETMLIDAADQLGQLAIDHGDAQLAGWAASKGLPSCPATKRCPGCRCERRLLHLGLRGRSRSWSGSRSLSLPECGNRARQPRSSQAVEDAGDAHRGFRQRCGLSLDDVGDGGGGQVDEVQYEDVGCLGLGVAPVWWTPDPGVRPGKGDPPMGRPSRCPEELRREAVELCRSRIVRVVGLGSLGVPDGSLAAWVRARRGAQTRRPEVDGPVRAGPARKGERGASAGSWDPRQPRPPILPGRRSGDPLRCSSRSSSDLSGQASVRARWAARGRGCPGALTGPCRRPTALMGNPGRDRRRPSRVTADLRHPLCSWPAETSRPAAQPQARWLGSWPNPAGSALMCARNGGEANGRGAPGPDLVGRDFTADASNQRRVTGISRVRLRRREALPGRDPRPYDRAIAGRSTGQRPNLRSRRQRRCGHGLGQVNPAGTSSSRRPRLAERIQLVVATPRLGGVIWEGRGGG